MSGYEVLTDSQFGVEAIPAISDKSFTHAAHVLSAAPMPPNVCRWEWQWIPNRITGALERIKVAIPFRCGCGAHSCYGNGGVWYCTTCWQASQPEPTRQESRASTEMPRQDDQTEGRQEACKRSLNRETP